MDQNQDPWDWSVDEVVLEFCQVRSTWTDSGRSALPDPTKFELILRDNDINGIALLSEVGQNELKADFEIKSIGQRSNIAWAIQQLRQRSTKYKNYFHSTLIHPPALSTGGQTPYSSNWHAYSPLHPTIGDTHLLQDSNENPAVPTREVTSTEHSALVGPGIPSTEGEHVANSGAPTGEICNASGNTLPIPNNQASTHHQHVESIPGQRRRAETLINQGGEKKRRLTLGQPIASITTSVAQPKIPDLNYLLMPLRSVLSGIKSLSPSFLGPNKLSLDQLFFGDGKFGRQVNSEWDIRPVPETLPPDDFELIVHPDRSIPGRQSVIYRRLLRFFNSANSPKEVEVNGVVAYVVAPYPGLDIAESSRSIILFQPTGTGVEITKEKASRFEAGGTFDLDSISNASSNQAWDYLDHWRQEKSELLPLYGASEVDSEWDRCMESIEAEEEAEAAEESRLNNRIIDRNRVDDVVDEEVTRFIEQWQTRKLPLRQNKAWATWRKATHSKQRIELATSSRNEAAKLTSRLEKLKRSIIDEEWYSEKKIRDLCKSMEETVNQREEERFKASIWLRAEPPSRPVTELRTKKKVRSLHESDQDGIDLSSDSEVFDDPDDDFIDIDMDTVDQVDMSNDLASYRELEFQSEKEFHQKSHQSFDQTTRSDLKSENSSDNEVVDCNPMLNTVRSEKGVATPPCPAEDIRPRKTPDNFIDLTLGDEEVDMKENSIKSSPDGRKSSPAHRSEQPEKFGSNPLADSDMKIAGWDYQQLEENGDRKRLIIKLVRTMPSNEYTRLARYILGEAGNDLPGQIFSAADAIRHTQTLSDNDDARVEQILRLYCCWLDGTADCFKHAIQSGSWGFHLPAIPPNLLEKVMDKLGKNDARRFSQFLRQVLEQFPDPILVQLSPNGENQLRRGESPNGSEGSDMEHSQNTPHKKRKRAVQESQNSKQKRDRAKNHRQEYENRARLQTQSSGLSESATGQHLVNIGKQADQDEIYLNPFIGQRIQAHQLEGIQFMWREVVAASANEDDQAGCLLAHTMGLGKTVQAIALLVTIAEAASSAKQTIRSQIPKNLRKSRTLIILPAALAYNWVDEFEKWLPPGNSADALGPIRTMRSEDKNPARLQTLELWYESGGVLIMSYDLLRLWVANNPTKLSAARFTYEEHAKVKKWLLEGPNLVIADEAHNLKNIDSKIHAAVTCFKTKSRIALTGSPLNNNLKEYYAMINWISPDYLGQKREFNARYVEPIQEGLYASSTAQERRTSRKKLKTLESILEPKIHRREVTVLKGRLKPKVEFSIKLPLTTIQEQAYRAFIESIDSNGAEIVSNVRLWSWMDNLTLLCNHPTLFWEKMKELKETKLADRAKSPQKKILDTAKDDLDIDLAESGAATPTASTEEQDVPAGVVQGVMGKLAQIMESLKANPNSSEHSYKVKLLVRLLKQSERVGDRVLVFSHSIATLNFLQRVLSRKKINFCRLDGQTQMGDRQAMMKEFNRGAWCVFLISTRAGGLGFNLPGANRVVLFDFHFNPTWEEQAIGRAYRLGQEKPVFVYRFFTGGTFEEELLNVAVFKIQLAYTVVEKKNIKSRAEKFAKWLVLPEPVHQEDLQDHKNKDEVLDRIIARSESEGKEGLYIRAIRTTETLQEEWDEILDDDDRLEIQNEIAREKSRLENPQAYRPFDYVTASALHALIPQGTPSLSFPPPPLPTNTHGQNKKSTSTLRESPNNSSDTLQTRVDNHLQSEFGKPLSYLRTTGLPDPLTARASSTLTASTYGLPSLQNHQRIQPSGLTPLRTDAGHQRVLPPNVQATAPQDSAQSTAQNSSIPATQVNRTHLSKSHDSS